jgi:hypothetical protein
LKRFRIFLYSVIFWNCLSRDLIKSIITFQIYEKRMFSFFFDKFIKSFIHNNNVMRREDKKLEFRPSIASIRKRLPVRWTLPPDGNDDDADYYPALILILLWIVSINLYLRSSLFMDSYLCIIWFQVLCKKNNSKLFTDHAINVCYAFQLSNIL